jgi:hypothetical protein
MIKHLAAGILLIAASGASAQVTSIVTSNPAPKGGHLDRMVCESEEKTGTRLGARRVCLTVAQWSDRRREHREHTEKVQKVVNLEPVR